MSKLEITPILIVLSLNGTIRYYLKNENKFKYRQNCKNND